MKNKKLKLSLLFTAFLCAGSIFAFQIPPDDGGGEHYCKNNSTLNTGLCTIAASTGVASCTTISQTSTVKDCYGEVNN